MNKFDFITNYKFYGRRVLKEDELDDALGLSADTSQGQQPENTSNSSTPPDESEISMDGNTPPAAEVKTEEVVELDVTSIVNKQNEINQTVTDILGKINSLVQTNMNLRNEMKNQAETDRKEYEKDINYLKNEIQKRNPTPVEQLQLRSMSSFPYNVKLSDFWQPTHEDKYRYAVANSKVNPTQSFQVEEKPNEEFVLKSSDIMSDYNDYKVRNSF